MKGAFFQKPFEWQIDVFGESWLQGQPVKGELKVKNTGSESAPLTGGVILSVADIKKVHSRDEKAFKPESQAEFKSVTLAPGESASLPFEFTLPVNCAVTDKKASYYVAYGQQMKESNLQLNVQPRKLFNEIIKIFETFQRFKLKEVKAAKGSVEFKLIPPTSRDFAHVEALHLMQSLEGEQLKLHFLFKVKTLDTASVTTKVAKDEKSMQKLLNPREYTMGRDMLNQDGVLKAINEVLDGVKMRGL